ncbi:RNA degradosome polyphosphate kinase [Salipaludibacillus neizhouensis]|uniref:Polyphosphate kinase n=1 Tax=Salipaludibacillus neizhouensis TaxID=885475 RepID=A0A3A9K340_9BACI|nr:RNA degradosome polyphosphate kinase [Salipaludibacillus neizhouensis]RKL65678.1 RNA degradosome polyphosphate kinase [Salipaludibacillus neizhouensis]
MDQNRKLNDPVLFNNREISWLAFNQRVLEEAMDERNLLIERFKFLAIFSANLDEFFMVRVAGLTDQVKVGFKKPDNKSGLTPKQQLSSIGQKTKELVEKQYYTYNENLLPYLNELDIAITSVNQLSDSQKTQMEKFFDEEIFPVLTPRAIDNYRPFPQFLNKSLNLAIIIDDHDDYDSNEEQFKLFKGKMAIVQVPGVIDRLVEVPSSSTNKIFILLEDLISFFIHKLFSGYKIKSVTPFRITRNADLTIHEDGAADLLSVIEEELKKRKWGAEIRLEIQGPHYDKNLLLYLQKRLEIHRGDTYIVDGPLDLTYLFSFYKWIENHYESLVDKPMTPLLNPELAGGKDIFTVALNQDILLHHPYNSFEPVNDFVSRAATDPSVLAIKQTLYRVSRDSTIIKSLKQAAINGKQVTVLVELKARFDEENNVSWAKELEKEGCHVIYGMTHLKTHSKITMVVRKKKGRIERFVHLGTGNYNGATAKLYTDIGLITTNEKIGVDATNFFNYISGYSEKPKYHHLSVAPFDIREEFIRLIDQEMMHHKLHKNGHMILKMNSLTDDVLIKKFYEASILGVKIELIIRGICCLRPGIEGISENIKVRSIVGRFLEHSRIFYFFHNGEERLYCSSADMMTRNMEMRIEILFPVLDKVLKQKVKEWLLLYLADNVKAREQDEEGNYYYVKPDGDSLLINSQLAIKEAIDRSAPNTNISKLNPEHSLFIRFLLNLMKSAKTK